MRPEPSAPFRHAVTATVLLVVVVLWLPWPGPLTLLNASAGLMPLVVAAGIWLHRPSHPGLWWSLAACGAVWGLWGLPAEIIAHPLVGALDGRFVLSVTGYVILVAGLLASSRRITDDHPAQTALDAAVFLVGGLAVLWSAAASDAFPVGRDASALVSPFLDLLAVIAATRVVAVSRGSAAPLLLLVALALVGSADLINLLDPADPASRTGLPFYLAGYALAAVAALHPSMARLGQRSTTATPHLDRVHLTSLAAAAVLPPLMLLREHAAPTAQVTAPLLLASATAFLLVVVRLEWMKGVVDRQRVQLQSLARTDHLTSLPNRRTGEAEMSRMLDEAVGQGVQLVAALLDLDHFKLYNDQHGHPAGDRLLEATSAAWRRALPPDVFLSRHGGEEFLLLAKGRHPDNVRLLLEGLRGASPGEQTFSAGAAAWDGVESLTSLVHRADQALYAAKAGGRDQVRFAARPAVTLAAADA